jgi:PAS domain S-box-containing protein
MRLNYLLRLRILFGIMIVLLLAATGATYQFGTPVLRANEEIIDQQRLIAETHETLSHLKDADNWEDAYVITGDEKFRQSYDTAVTEMRGHLASLQSQAEAGRRNPENVGSLTDLIDDKLAEMNHAITLRRESGLDVALTAVRSHMEADRMGGITQLVNKKVEQRHQTVLDLEQQSQRLTVSRTTVFVISGLVEILFCLWAYGRIVAGLRHQQEAAVEIRRQKDLLSVTLGSIGDAVMVTDTHARITFMNPVAETLTGWSVVEANGKPVHEVFRIVNEETREPVDNPVEKVIRLGMVVGLANHTLLLRKDGSELPIDDSGAPIRDEGQIHGAVLVFRDFTEHKQAEQALRQARAQAESANRAKDQFLAALSHELRTPLTPVSVTLDMWEAGGDFPEHLRGDLQMMKRNVDLEVRLIDDLLDLTKIARSKLPLHLQTVDMHEVLRSVAQIVRGEVEGKALRLAVALGAERRYVRADSARLQQILWNVLKNAVKFTAPGGAITVETANGAGGFMEVRVSDTGIGMSQEMIERIFKPFEQGTGETARRYGGLGLGLAISKALVKQQGGTITAASEGVGHGSTFVIRLPSVEAPSGEEARSEVSPAADPAAAPSHNGQAHAGRILLVEDHLDTARAMNRVLQRLGYEVKMAHTVKEALALAEGEQFDLLLSDLGLPDGTGLDLVRQVQSRRRIPAVALTGFGMEEDVARSREAGFSAHLTKPVNFQKLQATIHEALAHSGQGSVDRRQQTEVRS